MIIEIVRTNCFGPDIRKSGVWTGAHHIAVACEPHRPPAIGWRVLRSVIPLPHQIAAREECRIVDRDVEARTGRCSRAFFSGYTTSSNTTTVNNNVGLSSDHGESHDYPNTDAKQSSCLSRGRRPTAATVAGHVQRDPTDTGAAVHTEQNFSFESLGIDKWRALFCVRVSQVLLVHHRGTLLLSVY